MSGTVRSMERKLTSQHPRIGLHVYVAEQDSMPQYDHWEQKREKFYKWIVLATIFVEDQPISKDAFLPKQLDEFIQALRKGVTVISDWPSNSIPGELSICVFESGGPKLTLTAKAQGKDRWLKWAMWDGWVNLSPLDAIQLVDDLKAGQRVAEEIMDFLDDMP